MLMDCDTGSSYLAVSLWEAVKVIFLSFFFFFFCFFVFLEPHPPSACGGFQARGLIVAVAASLHHSRSNAGSKPRL